jgi:hypothetical protein
MSTVTIAVDLAKDVFERAAAGRAGTIRERERLSRGRPFVQPPRGDSLLL